MILKKLKFLFECDTFKELAERLGVKAETCYHWKRNGVPGHIEPLLKVIRKQQEEILKLKEGDDARNNKKEA